MLKVQKTIITKLLAVLLLFVVFSDGFYTVKKDFVRTQDTVLSRSKRSALPLDLCMPKDDDQTPITAPHEKQCDVFYKCNKKDKPKRQDCDYGYWYDKKIGNCSAIHNFPHRVQSRCFRDIGVSGTTKSFREVFVGRCWNYQIFEHPELFEEGYKDCDKLYELFRKAFADKRPCGDVKPQDYDEFFVEAHVESTPANKLLFWSAINTFSQEYSNGGKRLFTLENTLPGFLINELTWCGQKPRKNDEGKTDPGINFENCPPWGICENHPMVAFWEKASRYFGETAKDEIHLMLNGSNPDKLAFRNVSFFAQHELEVLNPTRVSKVKIMVAHRPGISIKETCATGSLLVLKSRLAAKGFSFLCEDNPADIMHLMCTENPNDKLCKKKIIPKKESNLTGKIFGYTVETEDDKK